MKMSELKVGDEVYKWPHGKWPRIEHCFVLAIDTELEFPRYGNRETTVNQKKGNLVVAVERNYGGIKDPEMNWNAENTRPNLLISVEEFQKRLADEKIAKAHKAAREAAEVSQHERDIATLKAAGFPVPYDSMSQVGVDGLAKWLRSKGLAP